MQIKYFLKIGQNILLSKEECFLEKKIVCDTDPGPQDPVLWRQ